MPAAGDPQVHSRHHVAQHHWNCPAGVHNHRPAFRLFPGLAGGPHEPRGCTEKRVSLESTTIVLAEIHESFRMAIAAITAHKLRSALTLLGVLVGVFSIIVVMTTMRVMQGDIEREMSQLGSHTFMVNKWPAIQFSGPEGMEKY